MAKKVKYPEMLVAEIKVQESKLNTLKAQFAANEAKIARLQQANKDIQTKASNIQKTLTLNKQRAQQSGISLN